MKFLERLNNFADEIKNDEKSSIAEFCVNDGVTEDEIADVERRLGFKLDERFLAYFRETNGWTLRWVQAAQLNESDAMKLLQTGKAYCGDLHVPTLADIFSDESQTSIGKGDSSYDLKILGGKFNDETLRDRLYHLEEMDADFYNFVTILADADDPNPICLLAHDHGADLTNYRPMRAVTYFEFQMAYLGNKDRIAGSFEAKGYDGDHPIIDLQPAAFPPFPYYPSGDNYTQVALFWEFETYLRTKAEYDLKGDDPVTVRPSIHYERTFAPKSRSKMDKAIDAVVSLGIFDEPVIEDGQALFKFEEFGPNFKDSVAVLRIAPPYGKKSPGAYLFFREEFPERHLEQVTQALLDFGMPPK